MAEYVKRTKPRRRFRKKGVRHKKSRGPKDKEK